MTDEKKPTITAQANDSFELDLTAAPAANIVPAGQDNVPAADANAGGLTYKSADADERAEMDRIIAGIDLLDPETIINLGKEQRQKLGDLSEQILDSIKPELKLAFAKAMKELLDAISANSIDEMKKRLAGGAMSQLGHAIGGLFGGKNREAKEAERMITSFMTDISASRKVISEMTDKLEAQVVELDKNYVNINSMGKALVATAQQMRIVRAAAAEKIRRIDSGEDTTLADLQAKAKASGRSDDMDKVTMANANWNNLRKADAGLLGSISVYDMNTANMAFTKQANLQNRLDTQVALANTVNEWRTQLATFAMVTSEKAAAILLNNVDKISAKAVQANQDMFDTLVDLTVGRSAQGPYNLRQLIGAQAHMQEKLAGIAAQVDANFDTLASDKVALEQSNQHFREAMVQGYTKNGGGFQTTAAPKPQP